MSKLKNALSWCRRYLSITLMVTVAVLTFVLFFNDNSVMRTYELQSEVERLEAEIRVNRDSLEYYQELNRRLSNDPDVMERVVREQYHMQRPGEDVFIIEE